MYSASEKWDTTALSFWMNRCVQSFTGNASQIIPLFYWKWSDMLPHTYSHYIHLVLKWHKWIHAVILNHHTCHTSTCSSIQSENYAVKLLFWEEKLVVSFPLLATNLTILALAICIYYIYINKSLPFGRTTFIFYLDIKNFNNINTYLCFV